MWPRPVSHLMAPAEKDQRSCSQSLPCVGPITSDQTRLPTSSHHNKLIPNAQTACDVRQVDSQKKCENFSRFESPAQTGDTSSSITGDHNVIQTNDSVTPSTESKGKTPVRQKGPLACIDCSRRKRRCKHHEADQGSQKLKLIQNPGENQNANLFFFLDWPVFTQHCAKILGGNETLTDEPVVKIRFCDRHCHGGSAAHVIYPIRQFRCSDSGPAPLFDLPQLRQTIADDFWGPGFQNADKTSWNVEEGRFWSQIELTAGFFAMLRILTTTSVQSSLSVSDSTCRWVIAHFVYSIGWELQTHYATIIRWCQQLMHSSDINMRPAVILYGLRALEEIIHNMQNTDCEVVEPYTTNGIQDLLASLYTWAERALTHIRSAHSWFAQKHGRENRVRCQLRPKPKFLAFAEQLKTLEFPREYHILIDPADSAKADLRFQSSDPPTSRNVNYFFDNTNSDSQVDDVDPATATVVWAAGPQRVADNNEVVQSANLQFDLSAFPPGEMVTPSGEIPPQAGGSNLNGLSDSLPWTQSLISNNAEAADELQVTPELDDFTEYVNGGYNVSTFDFSNSGSVYHGFQPWGTSSSTNSDLLHSFEEADSSYDIY